MKGAYVNGPLFFNPEPIITFLQFKEAVINGNLGLVRQYIANQHCQLSDPMEDQGYPDEDGYNSTIINSILYEAVPHHEVLNVLLADPRFNPNENHYDAFYRCLNLGDIEGLELFFQSPLFVCPKNALEKASELGGVDLIRYLLNKDANVGNTLFSENRKRNALAISVAYKDDEIAGMIESDLASVAPPFSYAK